MRVPILDTAITLALALGFAAVGEILLRRRSRDLFSWNESFLVGMGASAAALFPLSLLLPRRALYTTLVLIVLSAFAALRPGRVNRAEAPAAMPPPPGWDWLSRLTFCAVALVVAVFAALNFRYAHAWDGFQIWSTKAQLLYERGSLSREWFAGDGYELRLLTYPPLVPLYEALLSAVRGAFDFNALKPVFLPIYVSMLVSTFAAARAVRPVREAMLATLLVALVPALSTREAAGAYADMPQAAMVAGVVAACLRQEGRALPWLIGSLAMVKTEGAILAAIACFGVLVHWSKEGLRRLPRQIAVHGPGIAIVAALLGTRMAYVSWLEVSDTAYTRIDAAHIALAFDRFPRVARLCLEIMLDPLQWGLLWPAFLATGCFIALRGTARERALALAIAIAVAMDSAIFLFTALPMEQHISQAYSRLLAQVAPAACVAIVLGWKRVPGISTEWRRGKGRNPGAIIGSV